MSELMAYLAGLFDGEGCIQVTRHTPEQKGLAAKSKQPYYGLAVQIKMCDPTPVFLFKKTFPQISFLRMSPTYGFDKKGNPYRPTFRVKCTGKKAEEILRQLLPYLISKKEEAEYALKFRNYMRESNCKRTGFARKPVPEHIIAKRHEFYLNLRRMKHRHYTMPLA